MGVERIIPASIVLTLVVAGVTQASEVCDLLSRLDELPGIDIVQVNDTVYLVVMNVGAPQCDTEFYLDCNQPPWGPCRSSDCICPSTLALIVVT